MIIDLQKHCNDLIGEGIDTVVKKVQDEHELCITQESEGVVGRVRPSTVVILGEKKVAHVVQLRKEY